MKKMNKALISTITLVIVGLVISSGAYSVSISNIETTPEDNGIVAHYLMVKSQPLDKKSHDESKQLLTLESVQITSGEYDDYHPSVAGSPDGGFFAMMEYSEDGSIWQPAVYGSIDGVTWDPLSTFLYENAEYTDLDQNQHGTWGTFGPSPDYDGCVFLVDADTPDSSVYWNFAEQYDFREFSNDCIACYTCEGPEGDPGEWNFGGISFTGYNGYTPGSEIDGCPFVFYPTGEGSGTIGWLIGASANNCKHVGSTIDSYNNYHYAVYDRDKGDGVYELLVRKDNFGTWVPGDYYTHQYLTSKHVSSTTASLMYPSIAAYNNKVVVACQKDDDVVVFSSTNGFTSYTEVLIEESASYPEVEVAGGGTPFVITYIKNDILYYKTSTDSGKTWSDAQVVSDNQVHLNDRAVQLDEYNGNIYGVWEDNRNENVDIYFDIVYQTPNNPPTAPIITGPSTGKPGQELTFTFNAQDPDGDQIKYIIDWADTKSDTSDLLPSGTDWTKPHTWTTTGVYTIIAKAQDSNGAIGPETTKEITLRSKTKTLNLPWFMFLQKYPNAFLILKYLAGL